MNAEDLTSDEGIGLIEIVVSMFMLALLAVAFLPFLITSTTLVGTSANVTSAAELADARMTAARSASATCAGLAIANSEIDAGNGRILRTSSVRGTCAAPFPSAVDFTVTVTDLSTGKALATVATKIAVKAP